MADDLTPEVSAYLSRLGTKGGKIGGKRAAENLTSAQRKRRAKIASDAATRSLTPEERKERAQKAAAARWAKPGAKKAKAKKEQRGGK